MTYRLNLVVVLALSAGSARAATEGPGMDQFLSAARASSELILDGRVEAPAPDRLFAGAATDSILLKWSWWWG